MVLGVATTTGSGQSLTLVTPTAMQGTAQQCSFEGGIGGVTAPSKVDLVIMTPTLDAAPGPLVITCSGADPGAALTFTIGVDTIWTDVADVDGNLLATSIDLPLDMLAGTYTLVCTTTGNGSDSEDFVLTNDADPLPDPIPSDTDPIPVDSAGKWVFQDLMPGGLGDWVMPVNPTSMTNPHWEKNTTTNHTTSASTGRFVVAQGSYVGRPWRVTGYYPDEDSYKQLVAFAGIRRRFYVHDHRGRIWLVGVQTLSTTPRKRQSDAVSVDNDWAGNYDLTFVLYSQTPVEVGP